MAITNGYCTLQQAKDHKRITSTDATDDSVIELMVEDASRLVDSICGRWFYANTATYYYTTPDGIQLKLDHDLLAVTTLTNGDGTVIPPTIYHLIPKNISPYYGIRLKTLTGYYWQIDPTYGPEYAIQVAGSWGFVDRTATDPLSDTIIKNTRRATLDIFAMKYGERFGENTGGQVQVTAAGVVITPYGKIPDSAYKLISPYIKRGN